MRSRKDVLRGRVKGPIEIEFTEEPLTAYAGLELFGRFLRTEGWLDQLREVFADRAFDTDYGSFRMLLMTIGLMLLGGSRLAHLDQLRLDPLFRRFACLRRLPSERTFSRWLKDVSRDYQLRLRELLRDIAFETWGRGSLSRVTIDLDGTVIRTGECVDGADRGFHPHHPKDPSYYPLTAHLAQTGQILDVQNRSGRVNDSVGSVAMLEGLISETRERLGAVPIEVRLDGAFSHAHLPHPATITMTHSVGRSRMSITVSGNSVEWLQESRLIEALSSVSPERISETGSPRGNSTQCLHA